MAIFNDLTNTHFKGPLGFIPQYMFFKGIVKFDAEFIYKIENFGDIVIS